MPTISRQSPAPAKPKAKPGARPVSVLDRIGPIDIPDTLKMLVYGRSGTGKTTLWASFPGPILALVVSGGAEPGELRSVDRPGLREKISQVVIDSTEEIKTVFDHVRTTGKYALVVLDHATGLQDLALKEILGIDELPAQKRWGLATQQQYGQCSLMCKEIFRAALSLPTNVVIVAQEREFKSEGESELINPTVGAALTPSVTGWLNPACDYVVQTFIRPRMIAKETTIGKNTTTTYQRGKGVEYCLRTEPHDIYQTKFRVPKGHPLPEVIVDPSYDKIMAVIRGTAK